MKQVSRRGMLKTVGMGMALPLIPAAVVAQAAGLPCFFSDIVPEEADVIKPLVQQISLSKSPFVWAETILEARDTRSGISQADALAIVEKSPFNIALSLKILVQVYEANFSA